MAPQLQEGIHYAPGMRSGKFYTVLFLSADQSASIAQVGEAIGRLWQLYLRLKLGKIPDLPGEEVPNGSLSVMIGYGPSVFDLLGIGEKIPSALDRFGRFASPSIEGGGYPARRRTKLRTGYRP